MTSLAVLVRAFYAAREVADMDAVRARIDEHVVWREPDVGSHMGELRGVEAVLDMMGRAQAATNGTFRLCVIDTLESASHCAARIAWTAETDGTPLSGSELAVFLFAGDRIAEAVFFVDNIANDQQFWGEALERPER